MVCQIARAKQIAILDLITVVVVVWFSVLCQ